MPIVPSRAKRIQELVGQLQSERAATRESAVAQLTLLGRRAVEPLLAALPAANPGGRLGALEVLDRLRDPRALPEVLALSRDRDLEVARKALQLAGAYPQVRTAQTLAWALAQGPPELRGTAALSLARIHSEGVVEAIDPLLDVLLDEQEDDDLRLTVLGALSARDTPLDSKTLLTLLRRLQPTSGPALAREVAVLRNRLLGAAADTRDSLVRLVGRLLTVPPAGEEGLFRELVALGLPAAEALVETLLRSSRAEQAERIGRALRGYPPTVLDLLHRACARTNAPVPWRVLSDLLGHYGRPASIPVLHQALTRLASREGDGAGVAETRARIHQALAALDSRIALYDLREMLEARPARALPDLLAAAARIGDPSLLPALAALASETPETLGACAAAFSAIVRRHRLRRTSGALRAVEPAHRKALDLLWPRGRGR